MMPPIELASSRTLLASSPLCRPHARSTGAQHPGLVLDPLARFSRNSARADCRHLACRWMPSSITPIDEHSSSVNMKLIKV